MRPSLHSAPHRTIGALALSLLLCGCADAQVEAPAPFPDPGARKAAALHLREVARTEGDTLFSEITGVDADSRGRLYVADWFAARVTVFDSTGALLGTLGRKGLGPGEFHALRGVQVLPGDSLLVYDPSAARVSVFPPDADRPAYVVNIAAASGGPAPFLLHRTRSNHACVGLWRPQFTPDDATPRRDEVRLLATDGTRRGDVLLRFPSRSFLRVAQAGSFSVMPNPFGAEGFIAPAAGTETYHVAPGSAAVVRVAADGRETGRFTVPHDPPPVTGDEADAAVERLPAMMRDVFRQALRDSVPAHWPPVRGLLSDEAGAAWVALASPAGTATEWARFHPDGRYDGSAFLPPGAELRAVRGSRLYAVHSGEDGVPTVVTYRWDPQPERGDG